MNQIGLLRVGSCAIWYRYRFDQIQISLRVFAIRSEIVIQCLYHRGLIWDLCMFIIHHR